MVEFSSKSASNIVHKKKISSFIFNIVLNFSLASFFLILHKKYPAMLTSRHNTFCTGSNHIIQALTLFIRTIAFSLTLFRAFRESCNNYMIKNSDKHFLNIVPPVALWVLLYVDVVTKAKKKVGILPKGKFMPIVIPMISILGWPGI
jgi:hypothetical protein